MGLTVLSWCPGDKCDPCQCVFQTAVDFLVYGDKHSIMYNFGQGLNFCPQSIAWPFVTHHGLGGNPIQYIDATGAVPIGVVGGVLQNFESGSTGTVQLLYLGEIIFETHINITQAFHGYAGPGDPIVDQVYWSDAAVTEIKAVTDPFPPYATYLEIVGTQYTQPIANENLQADTLYLAEFSASSFLTPYISYQLHLDAQGNFLQNVFLSGAIYDGPIDPMQDAVFTLVATDQVFFNVPDVLWFSAQGSQQ